MESQNFLDRQNFLDGQRVSFEICFKMPSKTYNYIASHVKNNLPLQNTETEYS